MAFCQPKGVGICAFFLKFQDIQTPAEVWSVWYLDPLKYAQNTIPQEIFGCLGNRKHIQKQMA